MPETTDRVLYDLAGADPERRFSPYCWRIRMALTHKGLPFNTVPWRFADKDAIAFSGQGKVPVLVDGGQTISDSWEIATYLEAAYPDRPSLFGGAPAMAVIRFLNSWADRVMVPAVGPLIIMDIHDRLDEKDQPYFRETREKVFGRRLEEVQAERDRRVVEFRRAIEPLRMTLRTQPYLGGAGCSYADYIPFGVLQWARAISPFALLEADDPVWSWRERLLDAHDGYARRTPAYD